MCIALAHLLALPLPLVLEGPASSEGCASSANIHHLKQCYLMYELMSAFHMCLLLRAVLCLQAQWFPCVVHGTADALTHTKHTPTRYTDMQANTHTQTQSLARAHTHLLTYVHELSWHRGLVPIFHVLLFHLCTTVSTGTDIDKLKVAMHICAHSCTSTHTHTHIKTHTHTCRRRISYGTDSEGVWYLREWEKKNVSMIVSGSE